MNGKKRKDWVAESRESKSRPNQMYPEHYNHKIYDPDTGKWREVDD
jgi:hypothetical protein